jgi:hypothetical protein
LIAGYEALSLLATTAVLVCPYTPMGRQATTTLCAPMRPNEYWFKSPSSRGREGCSSSNTTQTAASSIGSAHTMATV